MNERAVIEREHLLAPELLADDAVARWHWLIARREAAIGAIRARRGDQGDYWAARAATMQSQMRVDPDAMPPLLDLILPEVDASTTVLDVGAGWGRYAIPLARRAAHVTAVEPAAALVALLRQNVSAAALPTGRLEILHTAWDAADVAPADIVLCANVLMPIAGVAPFVLKLAAHARRRCYVALRASAMDAPLAPLWQAIHGASYPRETTHADLFAVLDQLGIAAQVIVRPSPAAIWQFETPERAERFVRDRLWLGPPGEDRRADRLLHDWLAVALRPGERGWWIDAPEPRIALLWWEQRGAHAPR